MIASYTLTRITSEIVCAGGTILARVGRAFIHLLLAVAPRVPCLASAVVSVARVFAKARVPAQIGHVDSLLFGSYLAGHAGHIAVEPGPSAVALAAIQVVGLPALASMLAWGGFTPAHEILAVHAGETLGTGAFVGPIAVLTGPTIQTRLGVTLVDVMLTVTTYEASWAPAGERVNAIDASATIEARALSAVRGVVFTMNPAEP